MDGTPSAGRPGLYETSDFYLACFLRCSGDELAGLRRGRPRWGFPSRDRPTRQRDLLAFYGDRAAVVPLRFVGAIKDMKAMLHNVQGEGRWRGPGGVAIRDGCPDSPPAEAGGRSRGRGKREGRLAGRDLDGLGG